MITEIGLPEVLVQSGLVEEWRHVSADGKKPSYTGRHVEDECFDVESFTVDVYTGIVNDFELNLGCFEMKFCGVPVHSYRIFGRSLEDSARVFDYGDEETPGRVRDLYLRIKQDPRRNRISCSEHD